jgi:release factor glutamine methyltransferase
MTIQELYIWGKKELSGLEFPSEECGLLIERFLGKSRKDILISPDLVPDDNAAVSFRDAVYKRCTGYPLQYILGYWYFLDMKLKVKEGVLIPRNDTEVLVNAASEVIGYSSLTGIDLCAGTGAIALGIHRSCPNAHITALELYDTPLECLISNTDRYGDNMVKIKKSDVFSGPEPNDMFDFIVSNPPYISPADRFSLQKEVSFEPDVALFGGSDGLDFYRSIIRNWTHCIKTGGFLAFEIGETQKDDVTSMMSSAGFGDFSTYKDLSEYNRVIMGIRK